MPNNKKKRAATGHRTSHKKNGIAQKAKSTNSSRASRSNIYIVIAMVILAAAIAGYSYYTGHAGYRAVAKGRYIINASLLPNVSASNYTQPEITYFNETPSIFVPANITGFNIGYGTYVGNSTPITNDNVPNGAFSVVYVFNDTKSAISSFNYNYNVTLRQHTLDGLNVSTFPTPAIGNATVGFVVWPEYGVMAPYNLKAFIIIFRYKTTVARIGVYERINSTSPGAAISVAQGLLAKLRQ